MKKTLALILAACMSLSLVACGGGDKSNTPPAGGSNATSQTGGGSQQPSTGGGEAKTVGIAMPTQSLERWNRDGAYLDEQFKAAGYNTIVTYSDNKNDQQVYIYSSDDVLLYKSDIIPPGYKIESARLLETLEAGEYECRAEFHVLDSDKNDKAVINAPVGISVLR